MKTTIFGYTIEYEYRDAPTHSLEAEDATRIMHEIGQGFHSGSLVALMSPGYWMIV